MIWGYPHCMLNERDQAIAGKILDSGFPKSQDNDLVNQHEGMVLRAEVLAYYGHPFETPAINDVEVRLLDLLLPTLTLHQKQ